MKRGRWPVAGCVRWCSALVGAGVCAQVPDVLTVPDVFSRPPGQSTREAWEQGGDLREPTRAMSGFQGMQGMPYQAPEVMPRADYNIRLGSAGMNFFSSLSMTYSSNALLMAGGSGGGEDLWVQPGLGVSLNWPIRNNQSFRFDVGLGYRKSINYPEFDSFFVMPSSALDYRFAIGDVLVTLYAQSGSGMETRPEVVGGGNDPAAVAFNRIDVRTGLGVNWQPTQQQVVSASYDYQMNRSLGDQFKFLDMDTHNLALSTLRRFGAAVGAGIGANYAQSKFHMGFQNDMSQWGVGPMLDFRPNPAWNLAVSVRYTETSTRQTGAITDTSDFSGLTYSASLMHRMTDAIQHGANGGRMVGTGLGSNFTEAYFAGYNVQWQFMAAMRLSAGFNWTQFTQSGQVGTVLPVIVDGQLFLVPVTVVTSDSASIYAWTVGTGYQWTRRLDSGLSYAYTQQGSDRFTNRSFENHMVSLTLNYRF